MNHWIFLLFAFLTFGEFYKAYVSSLSVSQKFKIRKLVSTRYDLSQSIFNEKYYKFNPQIDLISNNIIFEPQDYIYLNEFQKPNMPTEEEIKAAKEYQNKPGVISDLIGLDNNIKPVREIKDINTQKDNEEDDNSGMKIQLVEKNLPEDE